MVNPVPGTPTITRTGDVLHSSATEGNQWYNTSGAIDGATSQDYSPAASGDYYVTVTSSVCSSNPSGTYIFYLTGTEKILSGNDIKIYPNPVSNELTIKMEGNSTETGFEIIDTMGKTVFKGTVADQTTIATGHLQPGVYLVKLGDGYTFDFKKIIKK